MIVSRPLQCTYCKSGERCDKQGLKLPETCPVGHHCENPAELFQCQRGTYQNDLNSTSCKQCELGNYCPKHGMDTTIPCHIGTYQNQIGQTTCMKCPAQTNCIEGMNLIITPIIQVQDDLISETHTLRIQYEYTQKECMGVAIEGIDIWYMGVIGLLKFKNSKANLKPIFKFIKVETINYGECPAGYECFGGQPNQCAIGKFNDEVNSKCQLCPDGFYTEQRKFTNRNNVIVKLNCNNVNVDIK